MGAGSSAACTLDYVVIDAEHGSRDRSQLASLSIVFKAAGLATIIRVAAPDPTLIAMALDAGADGVLVPYCERISDIRACVAGAKLHPLKGEYLERAFDTGVFPSEKSERYLKGLHEDHLIIIGIESEPALNRLDEIPGRWQHRRPVRGAERPDHVAGARRTSWRASGT